MDRIISELKAARRLLLATHNNPDGDAIGSLLALGLALERRHQEATLYNESAIPAVYRFLPGVDRVVRQIEDLSVFDAAVVIDCGDYRRIGEQAEQVIKVPCVINIDHHVTNTGFGQLQLIDTRASAAAELVYELIVKMGVTIDVDIATAVYTGIFTDTGSFRFSNTNRAAFAICARMVAAGVDPYEVARHVYGRYSLGRIKLLNLALDSLELSDNGKLSLMSLNREMLRETGTQAEDIDGMINYARRIEDVKVAVLIQENGETGAGEQYHVSLRSDGSVNVADIAAAFGGGGHLNAAGFTINSGLSEIKARMFTLAEGL